jgi:hypothetical protein
MASQKGASTYVLIILRLLLRSLCSNIGQRRRYLESSASRSWASLSVNKEAPSGVK